MRTDMRTGIIRVQLVCMNKGTRRILKDTVGIFRDAVSFLVHVACDHYEALRDLSPREQLTEMERLCHKTKDNPDPEYAVFDTLFYKYPSYTRRAAIHAAVGHIASHETRCGQYYSGRDFEVSRGHHFTKMAPAFTYTPNACPTLYRRESVRQNGRSVFIKTFVRNTWDWIGVRMSGKDHERLQRASEQGKVLNPKLVYEYHSFYLEFPVRYRGTKFPQSVPVREQTVLAVDLGLNNGAVCSVVDASGTILARGSDPFKADTDRILHVINLIRKKSATSGRGQSLSSLYTKLKGLKEDFVRQLARWITDLAMEHHVYGIVLENLRGIRGKGRGLRARVHHWAVTKVRDYIRGMAFREGIRVFLIDPRGTSMYAYDGSGKVARDRDNYSLCTFTTGKRYNCDLSASYNIGARYFLRACQKSMPATAWSELKAKVPGLSRRTEWTLHVLRCFHEEMTDRRSSSVS